MKSLKLRWLWLGLLVLVLVACGGNSANTANDEAANNTTENTTENTAGEENTAEEPVAEEPAAGIMALLYFSVVRKSNAQVKTLVVNIVGVNGDQKIISEQEVTRILQVAAGKSPLSKSNIKTLNLRKLEAKLNKDKRIERADLYFDSKNRLHVKVIQKKPIMRVIEVSGHEYYLDENGKQVPVTRGSAVRVPVVTGIRDTFSAKLLTSDKPSTLKNVFEILKYVAADEFLAALIDQAYVAQDSIGDIVLIPKIGREKSFLAMRVILKINLIT